MNNRYVPIHIIINIYDHLKDADLYADILDITLTKHASS
jgi:hypothetical protein